MDVTMKAIETTGTVDEENRIIPDTPLPISEKSRVRIIVLFLEKTDIDEKEWLQTASSNPAFDFLKEPEEDIYTLKDGKQFNDQE